MDDFHSMAELQDRIVRCFANAVEVQWDFLLANFERDETGDERVTDIHEVVFQKDGSTWKRVSIIAPTECEDLLNDLARLMSMDGKQAWSICTVEIDSSGKYRFSFSQEVPRRLYGNLDESRLHNYIPQNLP